MAGLFVFAPDQEEVGMSTGDDVAVNTFLDIQTDSLYFTDGENIYEWEGDTGNLQQTYIWKSGEVRMPAPVNMGAAIVEADAYTRVNGDPYFANTIHLANWEGTDNDTAFTEAAQSDTHTFYGNAVIDSAQANFGSTALFFDGTGDGVQSVGTTIYQLGSTDDVTVEGFVYFAALPTASNRMQLYGQNFTDSCNFMAEIFNNAGTYQLRGQFGLGTLPAANIPTPTLGVWYHFVVQRRYAAGNTQVDLFWNGSRVGQATSNNTPGSTTLLPITFGAYDDTITQTFTRVLNGWLDDTRVTRAARYGDVDTYTVPTTAFDTVAGSTYNIIFRLYADDVLKHTQIVADNEPFRLPGGYLSNIYSVEIESALPVTRVSVAENIFELSEG